MILLLSSIICFVTVVMLEQQDRLNLNKQDRLNLNKQDCENSLKWPGGNVCGIWNGDQCLKGEINGLNCEHKTNILGVLLVALSLVFFILSITSFIHNYRS